MPRFLTPRMLVLAVGTLVLVGGLAVGAMVPRALEVRDYEREIALGVAKVVNCSGAEECSAAATAERVSALQASVAKDDVSDRLDPIRVAYVERLDAELAFWRLQAAKKAGQAVSPESIDEVQRDMFAAGERRGELVEEIGGPLFPLFDS